MNYNNIRYVGRYVDQLKISMKLRTEDLFATFYNLSLNE